MDEGNVLFSNMSQRTSQHPKLRALPRRSKRSVFAKVICREVGMVVQFTQRRSYTNLFRKSPTPNYRSPEFPVVRLFEADLI
eukprot:2207599-Amphidinium_carterae.1